MNNQESIRLVRNLPTMCVFTDAYGEPIDSDAYYEAIELAISALQAQDLQPTCNNLANDTISRQAAIDALMDEFKRVPTNAIRAKDALEKLPPVTPKRKTGKWIPYGEKCREYIGTVLANVEYDYWSCDACGYRVEKGQPMYNFCPNCGAKMNSLPEPYQPKENKS